MKGALRVVLGGGLLALTFGAPNAQTDSGRIVFSGGVLEPTCSINHHQVNAALSSRSGLESASLRLTCGATPIAAGRSFSRTVAPLDAAAIANDRLLDYFAGYANDASDAPAAAILVVRTYE